MKSFWIGLILGPAVSALLPNKIVYAWGVALSKLGTAKLGKATSERLEALIQKKIAAFNEGLDFDDPIKVEVRRIKRQELVKKIKTKVLFWKG